MDFSNMTDLHATSGADWTLPRGHALRLRAVPRWRRLRVTRGRLWLTQSGAGPAREHDVWLGRGGVLALPAGSEWVIEGCGDAGFELLEAPPVAARPQAPQWAWLRRLGRWWPGRQARPFAPA